MIKKIDLKEEGVYKCQKNQIYKLQWALIINKLSNK